MKAIELWNLAKSYWDTENKYPRSKTDAPYLYYFANHTIDIHKHGDEDHYITVTWHKIWDQDYKTLLEEWTGNHYPIERFLKDLPGNDWEFYSTAQYFKFGYITCGDAQDFINKVYQTIEDTTENESKPFGLCGGISFFNGNVDSDISMYMSNGVELKIRTIKSLCKNNVARNYYRMKNLPFDKKFDNSDTVYITCCDFCDRVIEKDKKTLATEALAEFFEIMGLEESQFFEMQSEKPIYCA